MKLNRCDILALIVLAMGLMVLCLGPTPGARMAGIYVGGVGLIGVVLCFLFGTPDD